VGNALTENRQRLVAEPEHGPMPEGEAPIENASPTAHRDRKKTAVGWTLSMMPGLPKRTTFAWNIRIAPPPRQDQPSVSAANIRRRPRPVNRPCSDRPRALSRIEMISLRYASAVPSSDFTLRIRH
jgi:hypothetical protein